MIICVCHRISDRDISGAVKAGCASFDELQFELRVATACGKCLDCAQHTFAQHTFAQKTCAQQAAHSCGASASHRSNGHCIPGQPAPVAAPYRVGAVASAPV